MGKAGRPRKKRAREGKRWTAEEEEKLREMWGHRSTHLIAKELGRTYEAVYARAYHDLQLGTRSETVGAYTPEDLASILGVSKSTVLRWIHERGLKVKKISTADPRKTNLSVRKYIFFIFEENFLKWAKENQDAFNTRNFPPGTFGEEPDWLEKKRKKDESVKVKFKNQVEPVLWTIREENELIRLIKSNKHSRHEIAEMLNRTVTSVNSKWSNLVKEGKVVVEEKPKRDFYITEEDLKPTLSGRMRDSAKQKVISLYETGFYSYKDIAEMFKCSWVTIRSVIRTAKKNGKCKVPPNKVRRRKETTEQACS